MNFRTECQSQADLGLFEFEVGNTELKFLSSMMAHFWQLTMDRLYIILIYHKFESNAVCLVTVYA